MRNDRSDVFRFMAIREPDKLNDVDLARIKANEEGEETSVLLVKFKESYLSDAPTQTIEQIATKYVNGRLTGATTYTTSLNDLDPRLSEIDKKINANSVTGTVLFINNEIARLDITGENLADWKRRIGDSFHASLVLRDGKSVELRGLERAIRVLHVISQVKTKSISRDSEIKGALTKTITVSKFISGKAPSKDPAKPDEDREKERRDNLERVKKAVKDYEGNRAAINELADADDKDWEMRRLEQEGEGEIVTKAREIPAVYSGVLHRLGRWLGILPVSEKVNIPASTTPMRSSGRASLLAEEISKNISKNTKDRLTAIGSNPDKIEASHSISRLEEKNRKIARVLHSKAGHGATANLLGGYAVVDDFSAGSGETDRVSMLEFHYMDPSELGINSTDLPADASDSSPGDSPGESPGDSPVVDNISSNVKGRFQSLGVGELLVVKQKLIAYEEGEIAHIENVMKGEKRSRNHRTLNRTEEFTSFELEKEEEIERDLETTTRFELQKEIEKETQENSKKEAGLTVTGKYGPTVEFTANAGIASEKSSSKSKSLSTSYSKEVVDRSVQRIQEKIKEKRTLLTIEEVEVINEHSFGNIETVTEHTNGIYRWVNKKYEAQLFDYGTREIFEVVIPEPAAFLRHLATKHPKEGASIPKPQKPGIFVGPDMFLPLSVEMVQDNNYLDWVAAYNIQDITPPPTKTLIIANAFTTEPVDVPGTWRAVNIVNKEIKIPPGYVAKKAWYYIPMMPTNYSIPGKFNGAITIGRSTRIFIETDYYENNGGQVSLSNETGIVPIAISLATEHFFSMTLEVECKRTDDLMEDWRISTFNAIMNRYEALKEEYEESISGEELFASVDIQGKNPLENKSIILNELKRQVITQMTGQTFDEFDAMVEGVLPEGFPQHDVDEAWSEGQYVRFVEQAFEWENIQYLFYPYFWGKKKNWPVNSRLEDTDPLFKSFLQAGSCRVNIPVRPGFETPINTFLSTGEPPWDSSEGGTAVENEDGEEESDIFLSIAEELKAQQGAVYFKSDGTVSHAEGDPESVLTGDLVEELDGGNVVLNEDGEPALINGTDFVEDDINRQINIGGKIYMIIAVNVEEQKITLDEDISIQGSVPYGIGPKAIGVPWVVTVPTSLVMLHDGDELPEIPE